MVFPSPCCTILSGEVLFSHSPKFLFVTWSGPRLPVVGCLLTGSTLLPIVICQLASGSSGSTSESFGWWSLTAVWVLVLLEYASLRAFMVCGLRDWGSGSARILVMSSGTLYSTSRAPNRVLNAGGPIAWAKAHQVAEVVRSAAIPETPRSPTSPILVKLMSRTANMNRDAIPNDWPYSQKAVPDLQCDLRVAAEMVDPLPLFNISESQRYFIPATHLSPSVGFSSFSLCTTAYSSVK